MSFLYPQFLFGLLAVSIPILIHLFDLQKPKKVLFTNVRFLKSVKESTSSRLKLKHLLVLLSRILFVIFLVLTFAQPFISSDQNKLSSALSVGVYIDNSFSMQNEARDKQEQTFDAAVKSADKLSSLFPVNASYNLLTNEFEGKDQYFRNKEKFSERLTELKQTGVYKTGNQINNRQKQTFEGKSGTVFWFSDFQKTTIGLPAKEGIDSTLQYYFVPLQNKKTSNIFIDSVKLSTPLVKAGDNVQIEVKVFNDGPQEVKDLLLKLFMEEVQVSTSSVSIPANSSASATFVFTVDEKAPVRKCKILFEDFPVTFDNEYYFVINISSPIKVLHLYETVPGDIPKVYSNETLFELTSMKAGQLDYSLINGSHLIILDALQEIPASLIQPLKEFYKKNGSILIIPAAKADINSYNSLSSSLPGPKIVKNTADTSEKKNFEILPPDRDHPFFKNIFEPTAERIQMPFAIPMLGLGTKGDVLLKLKNNSPILSLFNNQQGKLYILATPLEPRYTDFNRHAIFVPVLYKMAFNSIAESERLAFSLQEDVAAIEIDEKERENVFSLESKGLKVIPAQRVSGRKLIMDIPRDELKAGFYDLKLKDQTVKVIAFNNGKQESKMEVFSPDEIKKAFAGMKNVHVYNVESDEDFLTTFKNEHVGIPLWKYCLILCLVFLMLEILLIRYFK